MDTLEKLELALEDQNEIAKDFKMAFENTKELYRKYEESYYEVLMCVTALLKDITTIVHKEGGSAIQEVAEPHSL